MAKRRKKRTSKIKAEESLSKSEQRKAFPKKLIEAFLAVSRNKWKSAKLYQEYVSQAEKYLGKKKYRDKIDSGKLVVLLCKVTADLRDGKKKKEK